MEYNYPKFTPEMKKTHTILIPNMAITQFRLLGYALRYDGYKCEILGNCGSAVAQLGLKYVHNDTCYPALLVIGQFLDALNSGKYDLEHTALLITQTGGGCRASNYIHLLRKALVKAGYPNIPVASLNFSGLEKDSGFQMTLPLARRAIASVFYGDMLCALRNQVAPYENEKGAADRMVDLWVERLGRVLLAGKGFTSREMKHTFPLIAKDFASVPVTRVPKVKVGVVGDISHSRVCGSLIPALKIMGCEVTVIAPPTLLPARPDILGADHVTSNLDEALPELDVVYMLRIQRERLEGAPYPSLREYNMLYGLTKDREHLMKPDALICHPGPINRGVEFDSYMADHPQRSVILEQVYAGICVRMAILYLLLGGADNGLAS